MMNEHKISTSRQGQYGRMFLAVALGVALIAAPLQAAEPTKAEAAKTVPAKKKPARTPVKKTTKAPASMKSEAVPMTTELAPFIELSVGQSHLIRFKSKFAKVSVDNPSVVQIMVTSPSEIVLHGKSTGSTVLIIKDKSGHITVVDVVVGSTMATALQGKLQQFLPSEKNIKVASAADSLVLTGTVADAVKVDKAVALAEAYSGKKVINFLSAGAPQQVMLEVKVAEVQKNLLDKLGAELTLGGTSGSWTYTLATGFLTTGGGTLSAVKDELRSLTLDAERKDGLIKILAEPTIMAMSGQEGSFLAGGRVFIPTAQSGTIGGSTVITLEEKEFGVGLKFTPIVLENGLINLKVSPEVSELSATGTTISSVGIGSNILPTITTRRASTTVQLHDGQSFAIGGLIKNNVTETIKAFPILGEIPILGALFRSSDFQNDRTELLFVVTPRLVKPLPPNYALPTDGFIEPNRSEFFLGGKMEGTPKEPQGTEGAPKAAADPKGAAEPKAEAGGFQMK